MELLENFFCPVMWSSAYWCSLRDGSVLCLLLENINSLSSKILRNCLKICDYSHKNCCTFWLAIIFRGWKSKSLCEICWMAMLSCKLSGFVCRDHCQLGYLKSTVCFNHPQDCCQSQHKEEIVAIQLCGAKSNGDFVFRCTTLYHSMGTMPVR